MAQLRFVCIIKVRRTFPIILPLTKLSTTRSSSHLPHMLSELNCHCHSTCVFSSNLTSSYQRLYHHHHPAIHGSCTTITTISGKRRAGSQHADKDGTQENKYVDTCVATFYEIR